MAQKHLWELLLEEQEPFDLGRYISDRRCHIRRSSPAAHLQVRRQKPITKNQNFNLGFCKNLCFLPVHESPQPRKYPAVDFQSTVKSPIRGFIRIPAGTASILHEAALRIHKQEVKSLKSKLENPENGSGLFRSILKRLTIGTGLEKARLQERASKTRFGCSRRFNEKPGNAVWTESDEDGDSLDCVFEAASSSGRLEAIEMTDELAFANSKAEDLDPRETGFLNSQPRSSLQASPSLFHSRCTPNCKSPATSPAGNKTKNSSEKLQEEEEEDNGIKEQSSPVSVLDPPPLEENGQVNHEDDDEDEPFHPECSWESVQNLRLKILLPRQGELEKRFSETEQENNSDREAFPLHLIEQEEGKIIPERVSMDMRSWEEIDYRSVDWMIEEEMKNCIDDWKRHQNQVQETAIEIELAVFGSLVEELSEDICFQVGFERDYK